MIPLPEVSTCLVYSAMRNYELSLEENDMMMKKATWGASVAFLVIGLIFTLVSSIMGGLNAFSNPIEWIVGVHGLLIWNSIAGTWLYIVKVITATLRRYFNFALQLSVTLWFCVALEQSSTST